MTSALVALSSIGEVEVFQSTQGEGGFGGVDVSRRRSLAESGRTWTVRFYPDGSPPHFGPQVRHGAHRAMYTAVHCIVE